MTTRTRGCTGTGNFGCWRIVGRGFDADGRDVEWGGIFHVVITSLSSVELPEVFALSGNYPNPFNPSTRIVFDLPSSAEVSVEVLDLLGRSVLTLGGQSIEAGSNRTVELDGSLLASGTYLYRVIAKLEGSIEVQTGRMVLIK